MIKSVFFSRFDTDKGPVVLHQVPGGSITSSNQSERTRSVPRASTPSEARPLSALAVTTSTTTATTATAGVAPRQAKTAAATATATATAAVGPTRRPLFDFASVSDYIIPRQEFCNQLLTVCANRCRIIGFPVCIADEARYGWNRNEYIFNFCLVLDEYADPTAHIKVVQSVARMLRGLEEESGFLSKDEERDGVGPTQSHASRKSPASAWREAAETSASDDELGFDHGNKHDDEHAPSQGRVFALCEMLLEDLNNYCECMIPIDGMTALSIRLAPTLPPPPAVRSWHVPVPTVRLSSLTDSNWDPTMLALLPFFDGTHTVATAARLAHIRTDLAKAAVRDLLYYGCVLLLDAFTFGAVYAPTPLIADFVADKTASASADLGRDDDEDGEEQADTPKNGAQQQQQHASATGASSKSDRQKRSSAMSSQQAECAAFVAHRGCQVTHDELIVLYCSLRPGLALRHWCADAARSAILTRVDVRRLISYGIISGFLYRVHRYAATPMRSGTVTPGLTAKAGSARRGNNDTKGKSTADGTLPLARYLDGLHCFDEICTELGMAEKEVMSKVRGHGDVYLMSR